MDTGAECVSFLLESKILENEFERNFNSAKITKAHRAWLLINHPDKSKNPLSHILTSRVNNCLDILRPLAVEYFYSQEQENGKPADFDSYYSMVWFTLTNLVNKIFPVWAPLWVQDMVLNVFLRLALFCMIHVYKNWGQNMTHVKKFLHKYGHRADFLVEEVRTIAVTPQVIRGTSRLVTEGMHLEMRRFVTPRSGSSKFMTPVNIGMSRYETPKSRKSSSKSESKSSLVTARSASSRFVTPMSSRSKKSKR